MKKALPLLFLPLISLASPAVCTVNPNWLKDEMRLASRGVGNSPFGISGNGSVSLNLNQQALFKRATETPNAQNWMAYSESMIGSSIDDAERAALQAVKYADQARSSATRQAADRLLRRIQEQKPQALAREAAARTARAAREPASVSEFRSALDRLLGTNGPGDIRQKIRTARERSTRIQAGFDESQRQAAREEWRALRRQADELAENDIVSTRYWNTAARRAGDPAQRASLSTELKDIAGNADMPASARARANQVLSNMETDGPSKAVYMERAAVEAASSGNPSALTYREQLGELLTTHVGLRNTTSNFNKGIGQYALAGKTEKISELVRARGYRQGTPQFNELVAQLRSLRSPNSSAINDQIAAAERAIYEATRPR